ncbi:DUF402 domain-containing protein [Chloroflexus sp. Y-396-1]|uniref:DUF402 domain-containing protein n=1 Tax=Chloroflexus sp. Y-396-1 TaxID=867845 RepID=UPI0004BB46A7|nr:DUF402 domain-containing protein [Chloroflexus sp. Y-396-1]
MIEIRLIKPAKGQTICYPATVITRDDRSVTVYAPWRLGRVDLGLFSIEPGDTMIETFYTDRWYNIFRVQRPDGTTCGWYCNVARPARISETTVETEDLEIDLIVSADRRYVELADLAEYEARGIAQNDPKTDAAVRMAIAELHDLIARGEAPFTAESINVQAIPYADDR